MKAQDRLHDANAGAAGMSRKSRPLNPENGVGGSYGRLLLMRGLKLLYVLVNVLLFAGCWKLFYCGHVIPHTGLYQEGVIYLLYAILLILLNRVYSAFDVGILRVSELVFSAILSELILGALTYLLTAMTWRVLPDVLPMIGLFTVQSVWNCLWALLSNKVFFMFHAPKSTVIIYRSESDLAKLENISKYAGRFDVQKYIVDPQNIHQLLHEVEGFEAIFVAGVSATLRNGVVKHCVENNVQCYAEPKVGDILLMGAKDMHMFSFPVMRIRRTIPSPEYRFFKRAFDIVGALAAIVVLSPVMLIIAAAIKLCDGDPVLYKQTRLTRYGREFRIWKFRSMRVDAEKDGVARLSTGEIDDRVTPVGRVIRACRLDELPQLFNILGGSMTFVGPRPERPEIAAQYEKELPAFRMRLNVKAGLTGYAQVYGRYNTQPYDKLQMDLMYINKMSFTEDIRLMLATVKILFIKESTEGVQADHALSAAQDTEAV